MTDVNIKSTPETVYSAPGIAANTFTIMVAQTGMCRLVYGESTPEKIFIPRGAISLHIVDLLSLKRLIEDTEKRYQTIAADASKPEKLKDDPVTEEFLKSMQQETSKVKE